MTEKPLAPTSDESLLAALSHFLGFLVALVIWVTQKDKSRYVRFQSLQAMAFHLIVPVFTIIVLGCVLAASLGLVALGIGELAIFGTQNNPTAQPVGVFIFLMTALPFAIPFIVLPLVLLIFVVRLIAAIETFQGKDFHYPWLGNLIERSTERQAQSQLEKRAD